MTDGSKERVLLYRWKSPAGFGKGTTIDKPVHTTAMCFTDYEKPQACKPQ